MLATDKLTALSSDAPCTPWYEPDSPFYGMYAAVTRQTANDDVVNASEAITINQAVLMYTKYAALIGGFHDNGSLQVGKAADFVILSDNLFNIPSAKIKDVKVQATYLAGKLVYQR